MAELMDVGTPVVEPEDMTDDDRLPGRRDGVAGLAAYTLGRLKTYLLAGVSFFPDFTGNAGKALLVNATEDGVEWGEVATGGGGGSGLYRFGSFFVAEPGADEVIMLHVATDAFTIPADFGGSQFDIGTNPSGDVELSFGLNGVEVGTVTVSSTGVVTLDTGAVDVDVAADDLLSLTAPADSLGLADVAFTFRGAETATGGGGGTAVYPALLPSLGNDSVGWTGITLRHRVDAAAFVPVATTKCRFALRSSDAEGLTVEKAYIGVESGTQFDFDGPPTAVTFSGNPNFVIAANRTIWSDEIDLPFAPGDDMLITIYVAAASSSADGFSSSLIPLNGGYQYKAGDDAATEVASGYTPSVTAKFMIAGLLMVVE